jgi:hypothetical protein
VVADIERQVQAAMADLRHAKGDAQTKYVAVWKHLLGTVQLCSGLIEAER